MFEKYLLDTHALLFWYSKQELSKEFIEFLDAQADRRNLYVSTISFWEVALLAKKRKIQLTHPQEWQKLLVKESGIRILSPSIEELTQSVFLPDHHKDPFDRVLITQALTHDAFLVTRDQEIPKYTVKTFWL